MKIRKCSVCKKYTLKLICCKKPTKQAGYKFKQYGKYISQDNK